MAAETLLDEVLLKFFQAAALLKHDSWLADVSSSVHVRIFV